MKVVKPVLRTNSNVVLGGHCFTTMSEEYFHWRYLQVGEGSNFVRENINFKEFMCNTCKSIK